MENVAQVPQAVKHIEATQPVITANVVPAPNEIPAVVPPMMVAPDIASNPVPVVTNMASPNINVLELLYVILGIN